MLYSVIRALLFRLDPEFSHDVVLSVLKRLGWLGNHLPSPTFQGTPVSCMGLSFPNRVGLAAGLDKNGECLPVWQRLGFGFVEVGTVTPKPQPGNPKPRLFRLPEHHAIINRMGFNNAGIEYLIDNLKRVKRYCPIGINIGKNKDTPLEQASDDYLYSFCKAYSWADYITINISSPNTPGLRSLQQSDHLKPLLAPLMEARKALSEEHSKQLPIVVKLSPDLSPESCQETIDILVKLQIDGVIVSNTTLDREALPAQGIYPEGGLSGAPLTHRSTQLIRAIYQHVGDELPIIGVGGILSAQDAKEKLDAGAKLVQIYTGFIYQGAQLIKNINLT